MAASNGYRRRGRNTDIIVAQEARLPAAAKRAWAATALRSGYHLHTGPTSRHLRAKSWGEHQMVILTRKRLQVAPTIPTTGALHTLHRAGRLLTLAISPHPKHTLHLIGHSVLSRPRPAVQATGAKAH